MSIRSGRVQAPGGVPQGSLGHGRVELARYAWVAPFAHGRRVLDAGCGTGAGARLLAEAGALEVLGVERAEALVEAAADDLPPVVRLIHAAPERLEAEPEAFGLITCFGLVEGAESARLLHVLARTLAPDGILALDAEGGDAEELVRAVLPEVRVLPEHRWEARTLVEENPDDHELRRLDAEGTPSGVLLLAGYAPPPAPPTTVLLTRPASASSPEAERQAELRDARAELVRLRDSDRQRREVVRQLAEAESRLATLLSVERRMTEVTAERHESEQRHARAVAALEAIQSSPSWRATGFLRSAKRALRDLLRS